MTETFFTKDHESIRVSGDIGTIGMSDYAQSLIGEVVFVELPAVGRALATGETAAAVESVKVVSALCAPVSGLVLTVNEGLEQRPVTVNEDPAGAGWFFTLKLDDRAELTGLMDEAGYRAYLASLS